VAGKLGTCESEIFVRIESAARFESGCSRLRVIIINYRHHHHHVRLCKTMTKRIVTLDKKVNESIGPFKNHKGNKIAVIIITRFSSKCQIVSTSSKVID